jgi:3-phosphoshikimate 1-carboxyvinyltransferase
MMLKVIKSKALDVTRVRIPSSKSHTIRALFIASLAEGKSTILNPLISEDAISAVRICKSFGAGIDGNKDIDEVTKVKKTEDIIESITVDGFEGKPKTPEDVLNVGNSGTTLRLGLSMAALAEGYTVFTGDTQIRMRALDSLITAINNLGGNAFSTRNNGMAPVIIKGRMKGGKTDIDAYTSQFLSSLLISCPLLENDTEIHIIRLNEVPYAEMTLWWLEKQGIKYENDDFKRIYIYGQQNYQNFKESISGDFSSATFFMVLAAISGSEIVLENLDMNDPQGDKLVLSILKNMGAKVSFNNDLIIIKGDGLRGKEIDMNSIPDALPAMAVAGCFAQGETRLVNVPQARLKETDRISVMCKELKKMGADISEIPDGLIIRRSKLTGCEVNGHYDHRIVMALAIAGLNAEGTTVIDTAEAMNITFPEFIYMIDKCGYNITLITD